MTLGVFPAYPASADGRPSVCPVTCLSSWRQPAVGTSVSVGMMAHSCHDTKTVSVWACYCQCASSIPLVDSNTEVDHFEFQIWLKSKWISAGCSSTEVAACDLLFQCLSSASARCQFKSTPSRWHFSSPSPGEWELDASSISLHWPPTLLHILKPSGHFTTCSSWWQEAKARWNCVSLSKLPGVRLPGNDCLIKASASASLRLLFSTAFNSYLLLPISSSHSKLSLSV